MIHSKSIHEEHQEEEVWYKEKNIENPDGTEGKSTFIKISHVEISLWG